MRTYYTTLNEPGTVIQHWVKISDQIRTPRDKQVVFQTKMWSSRFLGKYGRFGKVFNEELLGRQASKFSPQLYFSSSTTIDQESLATCTPSSSNQASAQALQGRQKFEFSTARSKDSLTNITAEPCINQSTIEDGYSILDYETEISSAYSNTGNVSLYSHMQSTVPQPFSYRCKPPSHINMPGGGLNRTEKYLYGDVQQFHPARYFSTSVNHSSNPKPKSVFSRSPPLQGTQFIDFKDIDDVPCPQGIQGDECVRFKIWLGNCVHFGMNEECNEQLQSLRSGRKTLAQIFAEQEEIIMKRGFKGSRPKRQYSTFTSRQAGHVTQNRCYSDGPKSEDVQNAQTDTTEKPPETEQPTAKLTSRQRLKIAVSQYGPTVMVFHVGISLISLGVCYVAVSSGIDVVGLLRYLGVGQAILDSKLAAGASTFVVAYAVHKVLMPVRIGITLTSVPFVVHYLRRIGLLKNPKK